MNIDNLKQALKETNTFTYKKLTDILQVPYRSGGCSKKKQLETFRRYFDFDMEHKKYIIVEVYPEPKAEIVKLRNNKTTLLLDKILLDILDAENETFKNQLLIETGILTEALKKVFTHNSIDDIATSFIKTEITKMFDRSLKSLKKHGFIELDKRLVKLDKYNTPLTEPEQEQYNQFEKDALIELSQTIGINFENLRQVKTSLKLQQYYDLVAEMCENEFDYVVATKLFIRKLECNKKFDFAELEQPDDTYKCMWELNKIVNNILLNKLNKNQYYIDFCYDKIKKLINLNDFKKSFEELEQEVNELIPQQQEELITAEKQYSFDLITKQYKCGNMTYKQYKQMINNCFDEFELMLLDVPAPPTSETEQTTEETTEETETLNFGA